MIKQVSLQNYFFQLDVAKSKESNFSEAHQVILQLYANIPKPKCASKLFSPENLNDTPTSMEVSIKEKKSEEKQKKVLDVSTMYEFRSSKKERAFVPPLADNLPSEKDDLKEKVDFLSVDAYAECDKTQKSSYSKRYYASSKDTYAPLKVKRLEGNPNRVKPKKVEKQ